MTGYVLVEKGKDRPIVIEIEDADTNKTVDIIVFKYKKDLKSTIVDMDKEFDEIKKVEIKVL